MTKVIVVKNTDGSCAIIHPAPALFDPDSRDRKEMARRGILFDTDEQVLAHVIQRNTELGLINGRECRITEASNIPTDKTFRAAWTDSFETETVDIDINKAKEIQKDKLRELRKPLLDGLDIEFQIALELGDPEKQSEVVAKKQALRDITKVRLPSDPEKLKNFIPDILR